MTTMDATILERYDVDNILTLNYNIFMPYKDPEKAKEWQRKYDARPDVKARKLEYENRPEVRLKIRKYQQERYKKYGKVIGDKQRASVKRWWKENPEKVYAHYLLYRAVEKGQVIKPKICSKCNLIKRLHGHHNDYKKPLEVLWLCSSCHKLLHLTY